MRGVSLEFIPHFEMARMLKPHGSDASSDNWGPWTANGRRGSGDCCGKTQIDSDTREDLHGDAQPRHWLNWGGAV